MRICVDWGNDNKNRGKFIDGVDTRQADIYKFFAEDKKLMAELRDDIKRILEMDDDEVRRTLDTLAEIKRWIDEHEEYGEIEAGKLVVEPGYSSLYKMCDGGIWIGK